MTPPHRRHRHARALPSCLRATAAAALLAALAACASMNDGTGADGTPAQVAAVGAAAAASEPAGGGVDAAPPAAAAPAEAATPAAPAASEPEVAVLPPFDPLQPEAPVNLDDRNAHADLWSRVRTGFEMPDLDTPDVREWEQWYASRPDYVARMTARGSRYLYHIVAEVERRHMPTELALLPFTESAFNPQAMSTAKASGMWQFIATTGKDFELKQNLFRDDRRDVLASTRAALDYLQKLHDMFGDWHLALAAYNCGQGNVARAIARNQKAGLPTDYTSLNLPAETRGYVPKLQAVKNIVAHPEAFSLALPALQNHPYFLSVPIERDMDVEVAARLAEVPLDEFRMLNPQLNKPVILAAGTPQVLLPYDNADNFVRNVERHHGALATWTAWVATRTVRPSEAARQVGMTEAQLREVNHIPAGMLIKSGSTLLVPRGAATTADVSSRVADNALMALAADVPPTRRVDVRVGRGGETVASVARRYHLTVAQLASWNHVGTGGRFGAGTTVVMFVPRAAAGRGGRVAMTQVAQAAAPAPVTMTVASSARGGKTPKGQARGTTAVAVASTSTSHAKGQARGKATVVAAAHPVQHGAHASGHAIAVPVSHRTPAAAGTSTAATKVRTKAPVRVAQP